MPAPAGTSARLSISSFQVGVLLDPDGGRLPAGLKPVIGSELIAETGIVCVRIAFESAVSSETACSGLFASPLRSIQRPSQPVLLFRSALASNQRSLLSKCDSVYFLASTAGSTARSEPGPPVPSPKSVSKPAVPPLLSAPDTVTLANASAAPAGPGICHEPTRPPALAPWPRWMNGRAST